MSEPIRVVIVDDERLAREGVRTLLEREPDMRVVGECGDGKSAVDLLRRGDVDVVLLDIQMPGMDGFDVLRALPDDALPVVVFLTAYDQHALRAFEAHALDYVVKPFTDERFQKAIARARKQVRQRRLGRAGSELAELIASLNADDPPERAAGADSRPRHLVRIPVRSVGRVTYVRVDDIIWIGSADYYAELHTADGKAHLVRETMQHLDERLDPSRFARVHRTAIVNLEHVTEIRTDSAERQFVVLRGGMRLPLGKARRDAVERMLATR